MESSVRKSKIVGAQSGAGFYSRNKALQLVISRPLIMINRQFAGPVTQMLGLGKGKRHWVQEMELKQLHDYRAIVCSL